MSLLTTGAPSFGRLGVALFLSAVLAACGVGTLGTTVPSTAAVSTSPTGDVDPGDTLPPPNGGGDSGCVAESDRAFCDRLALSCGAVSGTDNCGAARHVASCGTCTAPATCSGGGTANVCACADESDAELCARLDKECGTATGTDICGLTRTVTCGTCTPPETCGGGVCSCAAETDLTFCARVLKSCGAVSGTDNCGSPRTVASCGECTQPASCGGGGTANVCGTVGGTGKFVTGYWASWTAGNMIAYPYTKIDWTALTHLNVAFANPSAGGLSYQGGNLSSSLAKLITAAAHTNGRKAILMIGGVGSASSFASAVGGTAATAQAFAQKVVTFAQADGFDGVDLDWEGIYAGANGSPGDDVRMKNLAVALKSLWPTMVLTVAIGWDQTAQSFWATMKDADGAWLFDQLNVMNYDAANGWPGWDSWFFNALDDESSTHPSSIAASLTAFPASVPKSRIGCGLPFYGSAWTLAAGSGVTGPRQTLTTNFNAASQGADSTWTYKYILDNYVTPYTGTSPTDASGRATPDGTSVGTIFDRAAGAPLVTGGTAGYSRNGQPKITFLSYEDPTSIAAKGAWIKANGYGGTIIWLINQGATDTNGTNPLLTAVKQAFLE